MKAEIKKVFVIYSSEDLTEGRGPDVIRGFAISQSVAERFAVGKGVMGGKAYVKESDVLVVEVSSGNFKVPHQTIGGLTWFEFVTSDEDHQEKIASVKWATELVEEEPCTIQDAEVKLMCMTPEKQQEVLIAYRRAIRG